MVEGAPKWRPWVVCEQGFEVSGEAAAGIVPLLQIDAKNFRVGAAFRYRSDVVAERLVRHLAKVGAFGSEDERRAAVDAAATYEPGEGPTDLASIPWFMRWLVNSYGNHTLAAILHDEQIGEEPNAGSLRSDVVADRMFRELLHACGTSFMTRWIMWSAVALRSRYKAGRWKMAKVIGWGVSSVGGIGGTIWLWGQGRPLLALGWGVVALVVTGALWGRQWGAAVFAAIGLPFIAPAALLVLIAKGAFALLDLAIKRWDPPLPG